MTWLPSEILLNIAEHLAADNELSTVSSLAQSSHATFGLVLPVLYRGITITKHDSGKLFTGLIIPKQTHGKLARIFDPDKTYPGDLAWPKRPLPFRPDDTPSLNELVAENDGPTPYISNKASHARKTLALSYVRRINFQELPSYRLCMDLAILSAAHLTNSSISPWNVKSILPSLRVIDYGPDFIWEYVKWHDAHSRPGGMQVIHPIKFIVKPGSVDKIITYHMPTITPELQNQWIAERPEEVVLPRQRDGRPRFWGPFTWSWQNDLCHMHRHAKRLTWKNVITFDWGICIGGTTRVEFVPCECQEAGRDDGRPCLVHSFGWQSVRFLTEEMEAIGLRKRRSKGPGRSRIVLVNFGRGHGMVGQRQVEEDLLRAMRERDLEEACEMTFESSI